MPPFNLGGPDLRSEIRIGQRQILVARSGQSDPGDDKRLAGKAIPSNRVDRRSFPQLASGPALNSKREDDDDSHLSWRQKHEGHNFALIIGVIVGLLILIVLSTVIYVKCKPRRRRPDAQIPYGIVVLDPPSAQQGEPLLIQEPWRPDIASEPIRAVTITAPWQNRLGGMGRPSGLLPQSTLSRNGPVPGFVHLPPNLPPPNTHGLYSQQNIPIHPLPESDTMGLSYGINHRYPPPVSYSRYDSVPLRDSLDISAADSDSMQVNAPDSARFTEGGGRLTEEPEPMQVEVAPSESNSASRDRMSSLLRRALDSAREDARRASQSTSRTNSDRRDSVESEGSETASTLSSFARLKLRWTGSTPFLPLIEEGSPLATESFFERFKRYSGQSSSNSVQSARKPPVPKTSSPLTPAGSRKSSTISHPSSIPPLPKPESALYSISGTSAGSKYSLDGRQQPEISVNPPVSSTRGSDTVGQTPHTTRPEPNYQSSSQTAFDSNLGLSPPSAFNLQLSPLSMNTGDLPPTLNPSVEEVPQNLSKLWLTPDIPTLSTLPSQSPLGQSSQESSFAHNEINEPVSASSLSLSDFPDVPGSRPYRPLPIRPLPRAPQAPVVQPLPPPVPFGPPPPRLPPVPRSLPPRPPNINSSPQSASSYRSLPRVRTRFMPYPDGHQRNATTPHSQNHVPATLHKAAQSS